MHYIYAQPNESGNHGNPVSKQSEGMVGLPDSLLSDYINTMGFAILTVEEETVTAVSLNQEAYDAYQAEHQEVPPTADRDYEPGEYFTVDGTMYKVLLPIFSGSRITIGTNVEATTIETEISNLKKEDN